MLRMLLVAFTCIVLFAPPAMAKKPVEKAVVADTAEKFTALADTIRGQMAPGKRYEFLGKSDRLTVDQSLDNMAAMLQKAGSVDAMRPEEKTQLFNEQEKVNGILARNADDRLVCTHVAPVGSHLPVTQCRTAREIAQSRADYQRQREDYGNQGRIGTQDSR